MTALVAIVGLYLGVSATLVVWLTWEGTDKRILPFVALLALSWPVAAVRAVWWWVKGRLS